MADPQRPDWLDELISVVRRLCAEPGKGAPDGKPQKSRNLGRVSPDAELGPGWFWIGLASQAVESDQLEGAYVAPSEGAQQRKFRLIETIQVGNVLKVKVAKHAPSSGLFLWVGQPVRRGPRRRDTGESDRRRAGVECRTTARLDSLPLTRRAPRLGPPGTGKTKVIAQSLQDLVAGGKSVLLVSMTNIAVDNALAKAAAAIRPAPGVMVRVGTPHLTAILENSAVNLERLVAERQEDLERERHRLEEQISMLSADPVIVELAQVKAELAAFDAIAYGAAEARLAGAELLAEREAELAEVRRRGADAASAMAELDDRFGLVHAEHNAAETARPYIADAISCQRMQDDLKLAVGQAENAISKLEDERDRLAAELAAARARRRIGHRRFGPAINELANAVAYRGVLRAAGDSTVGAGEAEIVLVDVDGLGDELAAIRRRPGGRVAGWWPIGVLLARALAEHRVREVEEAGESASMKAGILAPYRDQQQLVQDILSESGASPHIEVGTSHRFQGREFDTVIFDLVEDGKGWVAQGDLQGTKWKADGVRLFNVGITRAQRRLYLIANVATIHQAETGPPHAVRQLLDADRIQVVSAAEVLGTPESPEDDPIVSEIWHALRDQATLIDLFDEDHLPDELGRRIDAARERIWLWSPWVGRRSEQLLPHLSAAEARGVRVHPVVLPRDHRRRRRGRPDRRRGTGGAGPMSIRLGRALDRGHGSG